MFSRGSNASSRHTLRGREVGPEIAKELGDARVGILCLTPENLSAEWLLFEAGALSKTLDQTFVCPYLLGLEPTAVTGPLSQFQAAKADRDDTQKLIETINGADGGPGLSDDRLARAFGMFWARLDEKLKPLIAAAPTKDQRPPQRPEREILTEILDLVRSMSRQSPGQGLVEGLFGASGGSLPRGAAGIYQDAAGNTRFITKAEISALEKKLGIGRVIRVRTLADDQARALEVGAEEEPKAGDKSPVG